MCVCLGDHGFIGVVSAGKQFKWFSDRWREGSRRGQCISCRLQSGTLTLSYLLLSVRYYVSRFVCDVIDLYQQVLLQTESEVAVVQLSDGQTTSVQGVIQAPQTSVIQSPQVQTVQVGTRVLIVSLHFSFILMWLFVCLIQLVLIWVYLLVFIRYQLVSVKFL